jgi:hypothetical protein
MAEKDRAVAPAHRGMIRWLTISLVVIGVWGPRAHADEGMYAGVDLLFLSPKISDQGVANIFYYGDLPTLNRVGGTLDSDLQFAQRVWLGYEGDQGGGVRLRWFTFDNDLNYVGQAENGSVFPLAGTANLDVDALDVELTQCGDFGTWQWLASGGVRYGRASLRENDINFETTPDFVWAGRTGYEFEGAGPTVNVEGHRPILADGVSIFGRGRTALLYGDLNLWSAFDSNGVYRIHDEFVQVWEIQFGTEIERSFDACDLVARIFWEAQRWDSDSGFLGDLGFHGFGTSIGLEY